MRRVAHFAREAVESRQFQALILVFIVAATVLLGVETVPEIAARHGPLLHLIDKIIIAVFMLEIVLRIVAEGRRPWRFFRDPWHVFDFVIVASSFIPEGGPFMAAARLFRILRVMRLITFAPKLQMIVGALLQAIPSIGYVALLLGVHSYVYALIGVHLFGPNDPVRFGGLGSAFLSLFQVMTLEGWTDIMKTQIYGCDVYGYADMAAQCVSPAHHPTAAVLYFVTFIVFGTMIILNLFIGVIVSGMEDMQRELRETGKAPLPPAPAVAKMPESRAGGSFRDVPQNRAFVPRRGLGENGDRVSFRCGRRLPWGAGVQSPRLRRQLSGRRTGASRTVRP